jgi:hypothetical protein
VDKLVMFALAVFDSTFLLGTILALLDSMASEEAVKAKSLAANVFESLRGWQKSKILAIPDVVLLFAE